tara:strand:- start:376 stop:840 length:465 start_codon:yes stop_codon:yes gene_type:complete
VKSLLDKLTERWMGVRLLEEEAKAEDVAEMLRINREQIRAHLRNTLGGNFSPEGVEQGSTHIGDVVHHHTETNTDTTSSGKKWLVKGLIAAALLGSGAGAPFLLNLLGGGLPDTPVVIPPTDGGSEYDLRLGEPDAVPRRAEEDSERGHSGVPR